MVMQTDIIEVSTAVELQKKDEQALTPWINNAYIKAATSQNTRIAYQSDIRHFELWGGKLPARPEMIAEYLQTYAATLNSRTLARRLTALKNWHTYQGFPDPTEHPAILKTMSGIHRVHGKPKDKAHPLAPEDLLRIVKSLSHDDSLSAIRDIALLQIGFFGAFRRSELVAIHCEHIDWKEQGIEIQIPQSKTDQTHAGQFAAIPYGKGLLCSVTALKNWLTLANIHHGPIFREIKKGESIQHKSLTPLTINHILKKRAHAAGISYADELSSHSLRRGLATSASFVGANIASIMRQGRWKQVNTVMEYVEASERFSENVSTKILQHMGLTGSLKEE